METSKSTCSLYVIIYGEEFINLFFEISIASQLASGNLPALIEEGLFDYEYVIFTRPADEQLIRQQPNFKKLAGLMRTKLEFVGLGDDKRLNGALCHKFIVQNSQGPDPAFIYITPDVVYSRNSIFNLVRPALEGKRLSLIGAIRTTKESMLPALRSQWIDETGTIDISGAQLVELSLDKLHYLSQTKLWNSDHFTFWPSYVLWPAGNEGLVQSYLHLCPMFVRPGKLKVTLFRDDGETEALDSGYYIEKLSPDPENWAIMDNSDRFCAMELVPANYYSDEVPKESTFSNPIDIALWIKYETSPVSRAFAKNLIAYHTEKAAGNFMRTYAEADSTMQEVLAWMDLFDRVPGSELSLFHKVLVSRNGEVSLRMERLGIKFGVDLKNPL